MRKSNIELLRVISMIWIMLSHCFAYGFFQCENATDLYNFENIVNRIFIGICSGGGDVGVGVFFIITGFFLAEAKKMRMYDPFIRQVYFYGILCTIIAVAINHVGICDIEVYTLISQTLIPLFGTWWFVAVYFFLLFLSGPINMILDNRKSWIVITTVAVWYSIGLVVHSPYYPLLRGIFYYMLGVIIRKRGNTIRKKWCLISFSSLGVIYSLLSMYSYSLGGMDKMGIIGQGIRFIQFTFISPLMAIALFTLFEQKEIKHNKLINTLGGASFGVYLFHEAPYSRILLWTKFFVVDRVVGNWWMPFYCIGIVLIIYAFVIMVERVRIVFFERTVCRCLSR